MSAFKQIAIEVNKREKGSSKNKFQKVGDMVVYVPLLADLMAFITSPISKDEKGNEVYEDGIPVYEDERASWLQGAVYAQVKAQARNKLVSGTADLKPGAKIAETWDELCAEGVRDGAGLKLFKEVKDAFSEWVSKQGISEKAAATLSTLFGNKAALALQTPDTKGKVAARVAAFADSLDPETLDKYQKPLAGILELCEAGDADTDF